MVVTPQYYYQGTLYVIVNMAKKPSTLDSVNFAVLDDACGVIDGSYSFPNEDMAAEWGRAEAIAIEENPILQSLLDFNDY